MQVHEKSIYLSSHIYQHCIHTRLQLAALHFNENACRDQAITKKGEGRYDILFPKYKKGGHIVRNVTVDPTYGKFVTMHWLYVHSTIIIIIRLHT